MAAIAKFIPGQPAGLGAAVDGGAAPIRDGTSNTFLIQDGSSNTLLIRDGTSNLHLIQDGTSNTVVFAALGDILVGGDHVLSGGAGEHGLIDGAAVDVAHFVPGGHIAPLDFLL